MYTSVKDQIDAFLKGFHELIPKKVVGVFTATELGLVIQGLTKVDLEDMKANTEYRGYNENSQQI